MERSQTDIFALPGGLRNYLAEVFIEDRKPVCFTVDSAFLVSELSGDISRYALDVQPGDDLRDALPFLHGANLTEPSDINMLHLDGDQTVNVHIMPNPANVQSSFVILLDSSAEMQRAMEHQQNANELTVMNYRQRQLLDQLEVARHEAEQASELKTHFIAGLSHEFRTPLSSILGYTGLMETGAANGNSQKFFGAIERSARHLLGLVENLLEHGRVEADKIDIDREPIEVEELFADLAAMQTPQAEQKGLLFEIFCDSCDCDWVSLDPVRIKQILVNLVTNAIRYTERGFVRVNWRQQNDQLIVKIADSGVGIAMEKQEEIFHAFSQGETLSSKAGLGLGLAISQHLAKLMGGDISLRSQPGEGSEFLLTISAPVTRAPRRTTGEIRVNEPRRILVVEDDMELGELLAIVLEDFGYTIKLAPTADAARTCLKDFRPHILLTDMNLPDATGAEVIAEVAKARPDLPILAMSAANTEDSRRRARDAGAQAYILKPFDFNELDRELERQLDVI